MSGTNFANLTRSALENTSSIFFKVELEKLSFFEGDDTENPKECVNLQLREKRKTHQDYQRLLEEYWLPWRGTIRIVP